MAIIMKTNAGKVSGKNKPIFVVLVGVHISEATTEISIEAPPKTINRVSCS